MTKTLRQYIQSLERLADKHGDNLPVVVKTFDKFNPYKKYRYEDVYNPKVVCQKTNPRILVNPI